MSPAPGAPAPDAIAPPSPARARSRASAAWDAAALLAALASLAWFLWRGIAALDIGEFGDETEKIVGARMIAAGGRLYETIFSNHGPLAFALNHLWLALTGTKDLASHRIVPLGLFVLAAAAVAASPALTCWRGRCRAAYLFLFPLGLLYAGAALHMTLYQGIGGALLVMALVLCPLPALLGIVPPRWAAAAAGFAAAGAALAAYPFAVSAALLPIAAVLAVPAGARLRLAIAYAAGGFGATALLALWMAFHADFAGYFVYHVWYNQTVYAGAVGYSPLAPLYAIVPRETNPQRLIHLFALAALYAAIALVILGRWPSLRRRLAWSTALAALSLGLAFFNPRGQGGFHAATFLVGALALLAVVSGRLTAASAPRALRRTGLALLAGCAGFLALVHARALSTPDELPLGEMARLRTALKASDDRQFRLVRALLRPHERMLAVVYAPAIYIKADRLPVSGQFYYLPVQARYAAQPVRGFHIDLCRDVRERRPKVVFYLDRVGNGRYGFAGYAPCVHAELAAHYVPLPWAPEYLVRRDIAAARPEILQDRE